MAKKQEQDLRSQRNILANNQVAVQYMALLEDLTKTLEEGARSLKENIAAERLRQKLLLKRLLHLFFHPSNRHKHR